MAEKPETRFRRRVQAKLDLIPNSWYESIQQKAIQGTPDILGCVNGYFVALELKATPASKPSALQRLKLQRIVDANGVAFVVHPQNLEETIDVLLHLSGRKRDKAQLVAS